MSVEDYKDFNWVSDLDDDDDDLEPEPETPEPEKKPKPRTAGDTPGHEFHGNQWSSVMSSISQPDGGFTYSPVSDSFPSEGFVVSARKDLERVVPAAKLSMVDLLQYADDNKAVLKESGNHLGGWHNAEDGNVYLDISTVVKTPEAAAKLARDHKQIAYFDLKQGKSVVTPND